MAIRNACKSLGTYDLSGCELYTTAEPCPMCRGAILWANISRVYYGCNINDTDRIGFRDKVFYEGGENISEELDREECLKVFEEYQAIKRKKKILICRDAQCAPVSERINCGRTLFAPTIQTCRRNAGGGVPYNSFSKH